MHVVEDPGRLSTQRVSNRPVIVDDWAEAVIELRRTQSRRRHPSNPEPAWEKDGGYETAEWVV